MVEGRDELAGYERAAGEQHARGPEEEQERARLPPAPDEHAHSQQQQNGLGGQQERRVVNAVAAGEHAQAEEVAPGQGREAIPVGKPGVPGGWYRGER